MEQLATLVLNGEGKQLIGKTSNQPDIQAFLDNVPIYMVRACSFAVISNRLLSQINELIISNMIDNCRGKSIKFMRRLAKVAFEIYKLL